MEGREGRQSGKNCTTIKINRSISHALSHECFISPEKDGACHKNMDKESFPATTGLLHEEI